MSSNSNTDFEKITKKLRKDTWNAIVDYNLIQNGDRIMVCLSGGKDSYTLLDILLHYQKNSNIQFELVAVNLDQKQPGFPVDVLPKYLSELGVEYKIVEQDTYSVVKEKIAEGKTTCSLCSRLRRGRLYTTAEELNCNKLALGHHRDDVVSTFLLNLFFGGKLEAMPPKYTTDDNRFEVIRPLVYCKESEIEKFSEFKNFPIIPCNLCGTQPKLQRQEIKKMVSEWEEQYPDRSSIILTALKNISPSHLLDKKWVDFK
ncbi:MAG: tRNA 2-thiocytidine(32) synthetase TtcA [Flavobacteriales bacterium]|nr:tRNA 2-thiocytidine(32) synthetase TtcA [Flavobacteriales bacterium]